MERKKLLLIHTPQLLFQRLLIIANSIDIGSVQLWEYELSINPLAIITKNGLLRPVTDKAKLTSYLAQFCKPESVPEDEDNLLFECSVLDMGSILHKVPLKKGDTYGQIINAYVMKVKFIQGIVMQYLMAIITTFHKVFNPYE